MVSKVSQIIVYALTNEFMKIMFTDLSLLLF